MQRLKSSWTKQPRPTKKLWLNSTRSPRSSKQTKRKVAVTQSSQKRPRRPPALATKRKRKSQKLKRRKIVLLLQTRPRLQMLESKLSRTKLPNSKRKLSP